MQNNHPHNTNSQLNPIPEYRQPEIAGYRSVFEGARVGAELFLEAT